MTDIRALLADALRKQVLTPSMADHVVDVLLHLPDVAIVGLPEPDEHDDEEPVWNVGDWEIIGWSDWVVVGAYRFAQPIGAVDVIRECPKDVRKLAAALLAAADAAENKSENRPQV
jgi:hypothetical protein